MSALAAGVQKRGDAVLLDSGTWCAGADAWRESIVDVSTLKWHSFAGSLALNHGIQIPR